MAEISCPCPCSEGRKEYLEDKNKSLGPKTDDIYRTCNLPKRFMYPRIFRGYRQEESPQPHPCYRSTSMDYGYFSPTVHTVPTVYYPKSTHFSEEVARGGMYRNRSLNTEIDKTFF